MAEKSPNNNGKKKVIRINLTWMYVLLLIGLGIMIFSRGGSNPQKIEWAEVQEIIANGDVEKIEFVRNDYQGNIKIKPERLGKYAEKFGGQVPRKSPHFFFLVSDKFNPEETFGALNEALPPAARFEVVLKNNDHTW